MANVYSEAHARLDFLISRRQTSTRYYLKRITAITKPVRERDQGSQSGTAIWRGPTDMEVLQIHSEGRRHVAAYPDLRGYLASRRQRTSTLRTGRSRLELFEQECKDSQQPSTAIGRRQPYWLKYKIARRLKWSEGSRLKYPISGTRRLRLIAATLVERQPRTHDRIRNFHPSDTNL
uniref:Uncharacterized protein n=1 Tax=Hyaloperonospora arabidopsidis (strain Emoy2) TaxID=559515 RepID=M4BTA6_HYAAE